MAETEKKKWAPPVDPYIQVQTQICEALEKGVVPWRKPWDPDKGTPSAAQNGATGHVYRGLNFFLMNSHPAVVLSGGDPRFFTFDQAKNLGYPVKRGERAAHVIFMKPVTFKKGAEGVDAADGESEEKGFVRRSYPVFHASQLQNVPEWKPSKEEAPWRTPEGVQKTIDGSPVPVRFGGSKAFYSPSEDVVVMPPKAAFASEVGFADTLFHEFGHSAGHESRLNRDFGSRYGEKARAFEEMVAELTSAMVGAAMGISSESSIQNNASYVGSWLALCKEDKSAFPRACAAAQKGADLICGWNPDYRAKMEASKAADADREATYEARAAEKAERAANPPAPVTFDQVPNVATAYRQMEQAAAKHERGTPVWEASRRILMISSYVAMRDSPKTLEAMSADPATRHVAVQAIGDAARTAEAVLAGRVIPPSGAGRLEDTAAEAKAVLKEANRRYKAAVTTAPAQAPKPEANLGGLNIAGALADAANAEAAAKAAASAPKPAEPQVTGPRL